MMKVAECNIVDCDAQYFFIGNYEQLLNEKGQLIRIGETPTEKCKTCQKIAKEFEFK